MYPDPWSPMPAGEMRCVLDRKGCFVAADPPFCTSLGWPLEALLARPLADWLHPDDLAVMAAEIARLEDDLGAAHVENRFRQPSGAYRWLAWTVWIHSDGRLLHARVLPARTVVAIERHIAGTLSTLSHGLVGSVGYLMAIPELLAENGSLDNEAREIIGKLPQYAEGIWKLVRDAHDGFDAFRRHSIREPIRLEKLLNEIAMDVEQRYRMQGIQLEYQIREWLPAVLLGSEKCLRVVLTWLVESWIAVKTDDANRDNHVIFEIENRDGKLVFRATGPYIEPMHYYHHDGFRTGSSVAELACMLGGELHVEALTENKTVVWLELTPVLPDAGSSQR